MNEKPAERKWGDMRKELLRAAGVVGLLLLIMLWLSGAFSEKVRPDSACPKSEPPHAMSHKVERRTFPLIVEQTGTVRARTEAAVSARVMAQVKEVLVREGDEVRGTDSVSGVPTVMARLEDRDIRAKLQQTRAQIAIMERSLESAGAQLAAATARGKAASATREKVAADYRRYEDLKRNAAATGQQLDHSRAQRDVASAQALAAQQDIRAAEAEMARIRALKNQAEGAAAEAEAMLDYTTIEAPFTGRVIKKLVNVGDMASPGQPLFVVVTQALPEFHCMVSESLVSCLSAGAEVNVRTDAPERTFMGKVREIAPMADPETRTVSVKVSLSPDPALLNGRYGRLEVPCGQYDALVVPSSSLRRVGQLDLVDAMGEDGHPVRRFVSIGRQRGDVTEVLSGLRENEEVIVP